MNKYIITTVATHENGMFKKLINNKFKKIQVLGFGMKWRGFQMKNELMYQYIKDLDDNLIVIFLDGFDSEIIQNPDIAIEKFLKNKYKVLFSKEVDAEFKKIVFPMCRKNVMINAGLYMGYVKYLKILLQDLLKETCKDDQYLINYKCKKYDFISIDTECSIFQNMSQINNKENKNPVFRQYPGLINFSRYFRMIKEYSQFFLKYLLIINIAIMYYFLRIKKIHYIFFQVIISYLFYKYIDTSCLYCK